MEQITAVTQPVRSEDRRAAELEELRKKQLAKSSNIEEHAGGSLLGGVSQPVTMESWFEQQRKQTKLNRLQKKDATENLHKYNSANINVSTTAGNNVKEELKKKKREATEILHNYRGQPEVFMSHQVKKHPKANVTQNKSPVKADVIAPNPGKKLETVGCVVPQAPQEDRISAAPLSERDRSGSQCASDWSLISGHDYSTHSDRGLSSTPVNVDMSMVIGALGNGADVAAGITSSVKSYNNGYDTPLSSSYVDTAAEDEKVEEKRWNVTYVTVSFGLLIHENDSPPEGTFTSHIKNDIVDNLLLKMRLMAEKSLVGQGDVMVAKQDDYPLSIMVQRDAKYIAPSNRPGVNRNLIKATIPINVLEGDLLGLSNAKATVYNTLRKSLSELMSKT